MDDDEFLTIKITQQAEIKIKGSRFIGTAAPVSAEDQAKDFIQKLSQKYYDATHNCYAFKCGLALSEIARYNDAGEPAGTAGLPILKVINGRNLTNVTVVITRYFGGTKLGKGGLIRAYSDCTQAVLDKCNIIKKYIYQSIQLQFDYAITGAVMRIISQFDAKVVDSRYANFTQLNISLRKSKIAEFREELIEITSGKIKINS